MNFKRFRFFFFIPIFILVALQVQTFKKENSGILGTCKEWNSLNCGKQGMKKNIGLLLTKDDGRILSTWFKQNSRYFTALVVLDGSVTTQTARLLFSNCNSVFYFHKSKYTFLEDFSDGELRKLGTDLVTELFGYDVWITMAHSDEFYYHSPLKIIELAEKEGAELVKWRALHILPHPGEYENYIKNPDSPVTELFRHYYHYGPEKGAFLEYRMFLNKPDLTWDHKQGSLLPLQLKKQLSIYPAYLHYKVHELTLDAYTSEGIHKNHWNKVSRKSYSKPDTKQGVGIRWNVHATRDFFVDHFPNSKKYNYVSVFENNHIESYLDVGDEYKEYGKCSNTF